MRVYDGEEEWTTNSFGFDALKRDVAGALVDFRFLHIVDDANIYELVSEHTSIDDIPSTTDVEEMSTEEKRVMLVWYGLFSVPELYDRAFGTEWRDEILNRIEELLDNAEEILEE